MTMTDSVEDTNHQPHPPVAKKPSTSNSFIVVLVAVVLATIALVVVGAAMLGVAVGTEQPVVDVANEPAHVASSTPEQTSEAQATSPASTPTSIEGSPDAEDASCSAGTMSAPRAQPELPDEVSSVRRFVINAAIACDYAELSALMGESFYAADGGGDAIELWKAQEANGVDPMAILVGTLSMPHKEITSDDGPEDASGPHTYTVWPSAAAYGIWSETPEADRAALTDIYSAEELAQFEELGYYAGYVVGIEHPGSWQYFTSYS
ncbi:MAG: hypothetical protein HKN94_05130 [Acidimicrobiales bacterium]|nr:hypothetical protein [Acidimicrobiales bacterium]